LQPGNSVLATWRARLDEQLGYFSIEVLRAHAASGPAASHVVYGVIHLAALCRLLPERDPHVEVYDALSEALGRLEDVQSAAACIVRFELQMLRELGYGLDLGACAVNGTTSDLRYVSPKSGRAVSRAAGEPWREQLLRLPAFLAGEEGPSPEDVIDGFALTGHFLRRHVIEPRGLAFEEARERFIAATLGERSRRTGAGRHR
jgi:DNA repair protein RecO (recombination protein O)